MGGPPTPLPRPPPHPLPAILESHSLTIDHGWLEVAQTSLAFIERFTER